jgi:hypothetical protein
MMESIVENLVGCRTLKKTEMGGTFIIGTRFDFHILRQCSQCVIAECGRKESRAVEIGAHTLEHCVIGGLQLIQMGSRVEATETI